VKKVFLDANVFFAAAGSPKGGSGFILELAKKGKLEIITVNQALPEVERNILKKLGVRYLHRHYQNLLEIRPKIQSIGFITLEEIAKFKKILPEKDIPILFGAIVNGAHFLITLDRKHFLGNEKLKKLKFPFKIMNLGDFLREYLKEK
jgi:predicted nucleic acid-binding protein